MSVLMPSWAMSGQALDGVADSHLAPGVHYRVLLSPVVGLPAMPLVVSRVNLGVGARRGKPRTDAVYVDAQGRYLTPPFDVAPDNPVTVHLPAGETCCWAEVEGEAARFGPLWPPIRPPVFRARKSVPDVIRPAEHALALPDDLVLPGLGHRLRELDLKLRPDVLRRFSTFAVDGVVATPWGDATVATRSSAPYQVYASHLERLVIRGRGHVRGVRWVAAENVHARELLRIQPLPSEAGARYAGPADGPDEAKQRVHRGAPQRYGMHEEPGASAPADCSSVGAGEEWTRVEALAGEVRHSLDRLINDLGAPPWQLADTLDVYDGARRIGTSQRRCADDVLQSCVDPGFARWLGTLDLDDSADADGEEVMAYVVTGLFQPNERALKERRLEATLPSGALVDRPEDALQHLPPDDRVAEWANALDRVEGRLLVGSVVLCATVAVPLDVPPPPMMAVPSDGASERTPPLSTWVPAPPPAVRREVRVGLAGLVPGAGLASAVTQPPGSAPIARNPEDRTGRRRLVTATLEPDGTSAAAGTIAHRDFDEHPATWAVAQLDWFGRWSRWSRRDVDAGVHPRPPRPTLLVNAVPPVVGVPPPSGPLAGSVRIEVAVPRPDAMAPGSRLLDQLALDVTRDGATTTTTHLLPNSAAPAETLVLTVPGPSLLPAASAAVRVTARWIDSAGAVSDDAEPKTATLHDPRPPAAVVIAPTLDYTARPDVMGRARALLEWNASPGQARFRVFAADETALMAKLRDAVAGTAGPASPSPAHAQAVIDAVEAAVDAPARGAAWAAHRTRLPRRWWLQVTRTPLEVPSSGPVTFTYGVSASLAVLTLFRVVAVSGAGAETDFASSPLVPIGVPNSLTPPQPVIEVVPATAASGEIVANVRVTVPAGPTKASRWRLRRASASTERLHMPVVAEGVAPAAAAADESQAFTICDTGGTLHAPGGGLTPWVQWQWRVEVQGPNEPGGGPPGEWSTASAPASASAVPENPPVPVTSLSGTRTGSSVRLEFMHPSPLRSGTLGSYSLDVYRQPPGAPMRLVTSVAGEAPPPVGRGGDVVQPFRVEVGSSEAEGTSYRVVVVDPIGRSSTPSQAVTP